MKGDRWLVRARPLAHPRLRLLCFPNAGVGASAYYNWTHLFPDDVEVCGVQLPGREGRISEPPLLHMPELLSATAYALLPWLDVPTVLFGHSMGSLIAYELTRELQRRGASLPEHLFVSGRRAPHSPKRALLTDATTDNQLIAFLKRLGGTRPEVFERPELLDLVLPILRADCELLDNHVHRPGEPLPCPITALGGLDDPEVTRDDLSAWEVHTSGGFALHMFEGGHFYLHSQLQTLVALVSRTIEDIRPSHRHRA